MNPARDETCRHEPKSEGVGDRGVISYFRVACSIGSKVGKKTNMYTYVQ